MLGKGVFTLGLCRTEARLNSTAFTHAGEMAAQYHASNRKLLPQRVSRLISTVR